MGRFSKNLLEWSATIYRRGRGFIVNGGYVYSFTWRVYPVRYADVATNYIIAVRKGVPLQRCLNCSVSPHICWITGCPGSNYCNKPYSLLRFCENVVVMRKIYVMQGDMSD